MPESARKVVTDQAVLEKTGKSWPEWTRILDQWNIPEKGHTATARFLREEHGLPRWWAQALTVRRERELGLRE